MVFVEISRADFQKQLHSYTHSKLTKTDTIPHKIVFLHYGKKKARKNRIRTRRSP